MLQSCSPCYSRAHTLEITGRNAVIGMCCAILSEAAIFEDVHHVSRIVSMILYGKQVARYAMVELGSSSVGL